MFKNLQSKYLSKTLREFAYDKAIGPDLIADNFYKKKMNGVPLMKHLEEWINGNYNLRENRAYLWSLPKWKEGEEPSVEKTRPIIFNTAY